MITRRIEGINLPDNRIFVTAFNYLKGELDNNYMVSNYGEVVSFNLQTPQLIGFDGKNQYRVFRPGRKQKDLYIHVVVWFSFAYQYYCVSPEGCPKPKCCREIKTADELMEYIGGRLQIDEDKASTCVHHMDIDKSNNELSNLLCVGKDIHDTLHWLRNTDHKEMGDSTDILSVSAKTREIDIDEPTLLDSEGKEAKTFDTVPMREIMKDFNALIRYHEPLMKAYIYDTWCQMVLELPRRASRTQYAKVELKDIKNELYYMIPSSEEWKWLPNEELFTFDFIKRIPQRKEWIDGNHGINIFVVQEFRQGTADGGGEDPAQDNGEPMRI